jgi:hypothetical protein
MKPGLVQFLIIWLGATSTLGIYSILYKENRVYRLFEHLFIGLASGFLVANTWNQVLRGDWWVPLYHHGQWWKMFPVLIAAMYYFVYSRKYSWVSRIIIGFFFGWYAGDTFVGFVTGLSPQLRASLKPLIMLNNPAGHGQPMFWWYSSLCNWVFLLALVTVMSYFFFSMEHRKKGFGRVLGTSAGMGRYFIMIYLGSIFGTTVMGRMSLLIGRLIFLFQDWIHIIPKS